VLLNPGEKKTITIECPLDRIRYWDPETETWEMEKMEYQLYMGSSSNEADLIKSSFTID
jgi:beta-glucosidase